VYIRIIYDKKAVEGSRTMLNRLFGNFLVEKQRITQEQLDSFLPVDKELKAEVETIAVILKMVTPAAAVELLDEIDKESERFGDKAVDEGLLTDDKLDTILTYQSNNFMRFAQILINNGIITLMEINKLIGDFQTGKGYNNSQISALVHDDTEQCVNIFVPLKSPSLKTLVLTIVQTITRLIDADMYLDKAYVSKSIQIDKYASQMIIGDMRIKVYLTAPDDGLLGVANHFTGDVYDKVNEDALDNVGEFINCMNGLFATNLSYEDVSVDMNSPEYSLEGPFISNSKVYVIPIHANGYEFKAVLEVFE
jgi:CheY-specific phosphatase CheX